MTFIQKHKQLYSYLMITIGAGVLAAGLQWFYDPIGLVTGGFSGLAIIVKEISSKLYDTD